MCVIYIYIYIIEQYYIYYIYILASQFLVSRVYTEAKMILFKAAEESGRLELVQMLFLP